MTDYSQLPEWTCHKVVRGGRIIATGEGYEDSPGIMRIMVDVGDGKSAVINVDRKVFARASPSAGDYLVVYSVGTPDEYFSWSPAAAFEDGYTKGRRDALTRPEPASASMTHAPARTEVCGTTGPRQPRVGDIVLYRRTDAPERDAWVPLLVTETVEVPGTDGPCVTGVIFEEGRSIDSAWIDHADHGTDVGCWRWPERG